MLTCFLLFSTNNALACLLCVQLLEGPCYHMDVITVEEKIEDTITWMQMCAAQEAKDSTKVVTLAKKVLNGYAAAIDWPASLYYKELMQAYPDAKVILTVRSTDEWYTSTFDTLWGVRQAQAGTWMIKVVPFVKQLNKFVDALIWSGPNSLFKGCFTNKEQACAIYESWGATGFAFEGVNARGLGTPPDEG